MSSFHPIAVAAAEPPSGNMSEEHAIGVKSPEHENPFNVPKRLQNHPELERRGIQLSDLMRPVSAKILCPTVFEMLISF